MYEVRYWNEEDGFQTNAASLNFMKWADASQRAIDDSKECDTPIAVVEDGQSLPYSIFLNGRQFARVEIDV